MRNCEYTDLIHASGLWIFLGSCGFYLRRRIGDLVVLRHRNSHTLEIHIPLSCATSFGAGATGGTGPLTCNACRPRSVNSANRFKSFNVNSYYRRSLISDYLERIFTRNRAIINYDPSMISSSLQICAGNIAAISWFNANDNDGIAVVPNTIHQNTLISIY